METMRRGREADAFRDFARPGVRASEFRVLRTTRLLASPLCKQERIASSPPGRDSRGFNRGGWTEDQPLLAAVLSYTRRESRVW